ncbi:GAP family protein [Actinokineospora cianjurensis]|uniref:Sap-like sulfolipid-1-addressing protein n=1 Tax=Actinokineospora cianjurensis TaxID=585224 RepID=A0A421BBV5_9PSEU|nr:GAP family protein [Actinokineospora cianjurensis]RLK61828.1 Sap-like sulfolipid-1-addressing protein [Actinokineospora cianjurensis]
MSGSTAILPLAITMMAGPQILSALVFVTARRPVALSLAFIGGVAVGASAGVVVTSWLAGRVLVDVEPMGLGIEITLVAILLGLALWNLVQRDSVEPPRWLTGMMAAGAARAFLTAALLITLFPSDAVVLLTVGTDLARTGSPALAAWPFVLATTVIAALPLLAYLAFGDRARRAMPRVREWLTSHTWLVNVVVCLFFVLLILL